MQSARQMWSWKEMMFVGHCDCNDSCALSCILMHSMLLFVLGIQIVSDEFTLGEMFLVLFDVTMRVQVK